MTFISKKIAHIIIISTFTSGCLQDQRAEGVRVDIIDQIVESVVSPQINLPKEVRKSDWGGPIYKAFAESENYLMRGTVELAWTVNTGVGQIIGSPVIFNDKVFVLGANGQVKCIDLTNRKVIWNFSVHPNQNVKKLIIGGGLSFDTTGNLYITTSLGELLSVSIDSGFLNWRYKTQTPIMDMPTVLTKNIFIMESSGESHSLSSTGKLNWSVAGLGNEHIRSKTGKPVPFGEVLLLPNASGVLSAVNISDGSKAWSFNFVTQRLGYAQNTFGAFNGDPGVFDETIYYGSANGQFNALSKAGEVIWQAKVGLQGSPLSLSSSLFFISDRNELVRLDKNSGDTVWSRSLKNKTGSEHFFSPILAGSKFWLTGADRFLRSFDVGSGIMKDQIAINSIPTGPPIYYLGSIIVSTDSGHLIAFK